MATAHYPSLGATALDAMAALAGPVGAADHRRAWDAAFGIVVAAMRAGMAAGRRPPLVCAVEARP